MELALPPPGILISGGGPYLGAILKAWPQEPGPHSRSPEIRKGALGEGWSWPCPPPGILISGGAIGQVLPYLRAILKALPQEPSPSPSLSRGNFEGLATRARPSFSLPRDKERRPGIRMELALPPPGILISGGL